MEDYYDGRYYYINNKKYSEKEIMKYLTTIGFTDNESKEYLYQLNYDYINKRRLILCVGNKF